MHANIWHEKNQTFIEELTMISKQVQSPNKLKLKTFISLLSNERKTLSIAIKFAYN